MLLGPNIGPKQNPDISSNLRKEFIAMFQSNRNEQSCRPKAISNFLQSFCETGKKRSSKKTALTCGESATQCVLDDGDKENRSKSNKMNPEQGGKGWGAEGQGDSGEGEVLQQPTHRWGLRANTWGGRGWGPLHATVPGGGGFLL